MEHLYGVKSTTTSKVEKAVAKSLLNNLFGRFGLSIHKSKTDLMDADAFNVIAQTKEIPIDFVYTVFIKIRYNQDENRMVGNQFGFDYYSNTAASAIADLLTNGRSKLEESLDHYNVTEANLAYVLFSFKQKDKKLLSEFAVMRGSSSDRKRKLPHLFDSERASVERGLYLPVSINEDSLGTPLDVGVSDGLIHDIPLEIRGKLVNFLDLIKAKASMLSPRHKDNITSFDSSYRFYLLKDRYQYVLAVKVLGGNQVDKLKYSLNGVVLNHITDTADVQGDTIIRHSGQTKLTIRDGKVISSIQPMLLKPLKTRTNPPLFVENENIGSIDLETYEARDGRTKVYAIGYITKLEDRPVICYINQDTLDSTEIVKTVVDALLKPKYSNVTFYCHNLGGYDIVFLLNILYSYNDSHPEDEYDISALLRDDKVIRVKITKGSHSFVIYDSYAMLPEKLSRLGESFGVSVLKTPFPYDFATQDNLFYKGDLPSIAYYPGINLEEYDLMKEPE